VSLKITEAEVFAAHKDCVYALCRGREENQFYSSGADGMILQWTLENNELARVISKTGQPIYTLLYLADRNILVAGQKDGGIHFIDLTDSKVIKSVKVHTLPVFDLIELPGQGMLCASGDGSLSVWNLNDFSCDFTLQISNQNLRCIALSPDNKFLAVSGSDALIRLYSLDTMQLLHTFQAHTLSVFSLAFTPDNAFLVSAGRDAQFRVWDLSALGNNNLIPAHLYTIHHILFSPGGKWMASAGMDKTLKLWNPDTWELLKVLDSTRYSAHTSSVNRLLWMKEGRVLLSASDDKKILAWCIQNL